MYAITNEGKCQVNRSVARCLSIINAFPCDVDVPEATADVVNISMHIADKQSNIAMYFVG